MEPKAKHLPKIYRTRADAKAEANQIRSANLKPVHLFGYDNHPYADKNGGVWVLCENDGVLCPTGIYPHFDVELP